MPLKKVKHSPLISQQCEAAFDWYKENTEIRGDTFNTFLRIIEEQPNNTLNTWLHKKLKSPPCKVRPNELKIIQVLATVPFICNFNPDSKDQALQDNIRNILLYFHTDKVKKNTLEKDNFLKHFITMRKTGIPNILQAQKEAREILRAQNTSRGPTRAQQCYRVLFFMLLPSIFSVIAPLFSVYYITQKVFAFLNYTGCRTLVDKCCRFRCRRIEKPTVEKYIQDRKKPEEKKLTDSGFHALGHKTPQELRERIKRKRRKTVPSS